MPDVNVPLRIAYIDYSSKLGGAEYLLLNLLNLLPRKEIIPFLFCRRGSALSLEAKKLGIQTEIIELPGFYSTSWVWGHEKVLNPFAVLWNGLGLVFTAWQLRQRIKPLRIDIIQTNTIPAHISGGLAARSLKISCVWYFHDLVETHRLAGFIGFIWRMLAAILPNWIIAVSHAVLNSLSTTPRRKVIYAGVLDTSKIENKTVPSLSKSLDLPDSSNLVGFLGRIAYTKGLEYLIEAAHLVVEQNHFIHFVIFGGVALGEENYKAKLDKSIEQLELINNWHWMGHVDYVKEYLKELDFFVFPSRREAFGLAVVEAGLSGKAVIASSVGGIPEIIENGSTGIIVTPEDAGQLASAIMKLVNNPKLAIVMGKNARIRVSTLFNNTRYRDEFLEFYRTVTG